MPSNWYSPTKSPAARPTVPRCAPAPPAWAPGGPAPTRWSDLLDLRRQAGGRLTEAATTAARPPTWTCWPSWTWTSMTVPIPNARGLANGLRFLLDKSAHELARRDLEAQRTFETMAVTGPGHRRDRRARDLVLGPQSHRPPAAKGVPASAMRVAGDQPRHPVPRPWTCMRRCWTWVCIAGHSGPDHRVGRRAHDAVLVHHDCDFDDLATVAAGLRTRWIVTPQSGTR